MKTDHSRVPGSRGFTLIELIVTIIIIAIMATMYVMIMGGPLVGNVKQLNNLNNSMALYQAMEAMIGDYNNLMVTNATPLATFSTRVQNNTANYGTYTIVQNSYVTYNAAGVESASAGGTTGAQTLKVRISNGGITLTALFTQ